MKILRRPKEKTLGTVRYFTYTLEFPDGEVWVDQTPFVHDLSFTLKNSAFRKNPDVCRKLISSGEAHWKDHNGVKHRVLIESQDRDTNWGVKRNQH